MEALIKFDKQELIKSIHANNEMISLTDLWKQSGEDAQRTPAKWQESEPVQRFIQTASKILNIGISDIIKSKRGKGGGTYAHKQIHSNTNENTAMKKIKEFAMWFFSNILLSENANKRLSNAILIAAGVFFLLQILRSIIQNNGGSF